MTGAPERIWAWTYSDPWGNELRWWTGEYQSDDQDAHKYVRADLAAPRVRKTTEPFVAIDGQSFHSHQDWVNRASRALTSHSEYRNTEHDGPSKGWRGAHFTALCFDQKGRRCRNGGDMKRAEDEGAFPIWWVWPDQIAGLIMGETSHDRA